MNIKILQIAKSDLKRIKNSFFKMFGIILTPQQVADYSVSTVNTIPPEVIESVALFKDIKTNISITVPRYTKRILDYYVNKYCRHINNRYEVVVAAFIKIRSATISLQYQKLKIMKVNLAIDNISRQIEIGDKTVTTYVSNYKNQKMIKI